MNLEAIGGRRFLLTVLTQVSVTWLVWAAKISDQVYATVVLATVAAYIAGNTAQKLKAPQQ